jgi:hypothetical protein
MPAQLGRGSDAFSLGSTSKVDARLADLAVDMADHEPMIATDRGRRLGAAAVIAMLLAPIALVGSLVLLTKDISVPIQGNGAADDSSCGSAYDVTFIKRDGYLGGEYPPNQDEIDSACASRSRRYAYPGAALGLLVPLSIAFVVFKIRRPKSPT